MVRPPHMGVIRRHRSWFRGRIIIRSQEVHDPTFGRPIGHKITSTISIGWNFTTKSGGIWKGTMRTVGILAAIALLLGVGFAAFDHVIALTIETAYRNEYHRAPLSRDQLSMAYIPVKVQ